jgi:hypothetical protein
MISIYKLFCILYFITLQKVDFKEMRMILAKSLILNKE